MAPVKFETDDTVVMLANQKAKRRRCGRSIRGPMEQIELKMGVITTTFSDEEESDSDDEDNTDRLTSGSVRVEWYANCGRFIYSYS